MVEIIPLIGSQSRPFLKELARLRIDVFREFPYLYDGDLEYEERYLANSFTSPDSVLVIARDSERNQVVGASTAMPLMSAGLPFQSVISSIGVEPGDIHYFGESVLLREYRGMGIGHQFFDQREAFAKAAGFRTTAFCAVIRPPDHPQRPSGHHSHDAFWSKRGYRHHPDLRVTLPWREPGRRTEIPHELSFWMRHFPDE